MVRVSANGLFGPALTAHVVLSVAMPALDQRDSIADRFFGLFLFLEVFSAAYVDQIGLGYPLGFPETDFRGITDSDLHRRDALAVSA